MKVQEESEKVGLKLKIQKMKIMVSGPITLWEIDGETVETVSDFIFWAWARSDSERSFAAEFEQESQASSCVEEWNSACLSSCSRGDRSLLELCVVPAGSQLPCVIWSILLDAKSYR